MPDPQPALDTVAELEAELVGRPTSPFRRLARLIKRAADIVFALLGLALMGPLTLLLAWLVKRESAGPGFFVQERLGECGRPFCMIKLRTMVQDAESKGAGLGVESGDPRITRLGRLLRKTSLDEFPQLWNVLVGQMSFVGPRPLPISYLERWGGHQRRRLLAPQGITGWSQMLARNDAPWADRLELDVWYVENWSLWLDARIFCGTIVSVLMRRGVETAEGGVTEFTGDAQSDGSTGNATPGAD